MRKLVLVMITGLGLTASSTAFAVDPACTALPDEPGSGPIKQLYIENGDTQELMIQALGQKLIHSATPLRVIYRNRPTCELRGDLFGKTPMITVSTPTVRAVKYIVTDPLAADAARAKICTVPDADTPAGTAHPIQLGIGATYLSSCAALAQPADIGVYDGPIQAYGFITNNGSLQPGITAEAAYLAWGFPDAAGDSSPWVETALRIKRGNTASTTLTMAAAIHMQAADMQGTLPKDPTTSATSDSSANLIANIANANHPEAALGELGADLWDRNRAAVKWLPFRSWGQRKGYYPDKTKDTHEKQNVRDGHYVPWAPTPYIAVKNAAGDINDADALRFYNLVRGFTDETDVHGLAIIAGNSLIPQCAMKVTRAGDGADLTSYTDPAPCNCFYEANVKLGTTKCATCTGDNTACGTAGKCHFGYCEEKK